MTRRLYLDLFLFSILFSIVFCYFCSLVDNLMSFWVFLELAGLAVVPSFFYSDFSNVYGFYSSLLTYIIMAGLSSIFLVVGIIFSELYYFIFWGFFIKFGMFPFSLLMYRIFSNSNWVFIFILSVILKFPILFFCYLFQNTAHHIIILDSSLTIFMCAVFFWVFSMDWNFIWCHMSLSSVSTLLVGCFCSSADLCYFIYFYYCVWSFCCIIYFYFSGGAGSLISNFWMYCFLFLVTPVSLPLFYKLSVSLAIFYSSFYLLVVWWFYGFAEQLFFFKLGSDFFFSNVYNIWA